MKTAIQNGAIMTAQQLAGLGNEAGVIQPRTYQLAKDFLVDYNRESSMVSDCCGARLLRESDDKICAACKEHCEKVNENEEN